MGAVVGAVKIKVRGSRSFITVPRFYRMSKIVLPYPCGTDYDEERWQSDVTYPSFPPGLEQGWRGWPLETVFCKLRLMRCCFAY